MRLGHVRLAAIVLYTDKHHICTPRSDRRCIQQHLCVHAGTKFCVRVLCVRVLGCVSVFLPGCLSAGLSVCMDADRQQPFVHACMHPCTETHVNVRLPLFCLLACLQIFLDHSIEIEQSKLQPEHWVELGFRCAAGNEYFRGGTRLLRVWNPEHFTGLNNHRYRSLGFLIRILIVLVDPKSKPF